MHNGKLNNTRYNDSGKPMKKSSFKVKKPGRNDPKRTINYIK